MDENHSTCGCGGSCGCGGHEKDEPEVFLTREEYIQRLEAYLSDLKAETEAVEKELNLLRETA